MGNPILADILTFFPIFQPMALAQEKPTSPPAQPAPAPARAAFDGVVGSWPIANGPNANKSAFRLRPIFPKLTKRAWGLEKLDFARPCDPSLPALGPRGFLIRAQKGAMLKHWRLAEA